MIPASYLRRIRQIEVKTRRLADELFAGDYHAIFKGRGLDFEDVREYEPGDDVRQIDWNMTARSGTPFIKKYREEREMPLYLLVDVSASGEMASGAMSKRELAAEIAACLAYSAIRNRDRVGLMLFSSRVEKWIPARRGSDHVLRLIRDILFSEPALPGTSLKTALESFYHARSRRSVLFVLSDFIDRGYEKSLAVVGRKHDVIPLVVEDPGECDLPDAGWLTLRDAESGEQVEIDSSAAAVRERYGRDQRRRRAALRGLFKRAGLTPVEVRTDRPYVDALRQFFSSRRHVRPNGAAA